MRLPLRAPRPSARKLELDRIANGMAEQQLVSFFTRVAQTVGFPRSVGQIYGTLFCSPRPLAFEELTRCSGVSKGAVSQGVRTLTGIHVIRAVTVPNDRRTFFEVETGARRLMTSLLRDSVEPFLDRNEEELRSIGEDLAGTSSGTSETGSPGIEELRTRINAILRWHNEVRGLLPLAIAFSAEKADEVRSAPGSNGSLPRASEG